MPAKKKDAPSELMIVNDAPGEECRIAILENNHLEELYSERVATATNVGNIYKGRVVNVEPAIQAAFIDYGKGVNGFLHISDLHPRYFPGGDRVERVGRKIPRRERPPIQQALKRGDEVLVQVLKEGIGTKGPTLTSYLSVPGRLLVVMPGMDRIGVSRKVEDEDKRREMRRILDSLDLPDGFGFILRTAGFGRTKTELKRDVAYLMRLWKVMEKRINTVGAPCELYTESDLLIRTVRDVMRPAISAIVVDSQSAYDRVSSFLRVIAPRSAPEVVRYRRSTPIFHAFDIERQIELIHSREVPLTSGGRLVIDQTEALVAIDVNSGKSRSARDSETNAYQTNCEAVDEICRQLRLRDLGGLIINDLIDMRHNRHRRQIEDRFRENLKRDRARSTILRISDFGLLEMTRQRMRPSLRKSHFVTCPVCRGQGEIKAPESLAADVTRQVGFFLDHNRVRRIEIVCSPRVASVLLSRKRRELVHLEEATGKTIDVRVSDDIDVDRVDYYAYDDRSADIDLKHLPLPQRPGLDELRSEAKAREKAEQKKQDEASRPEQEDKPAKKKRSRRKRRGPADATAVALAGGFDNEDIEEAGRSKPTSEEDAETDRKRPRRRRRRRKGVPAPDAETVPAEWSPAAKGQKRTTGRRRKTKKSTPEKSKTARPTSPSSDDQKADDSSGSDDSRAWRVHELAKDLGVKSREVIEQCRQDGEVTVKSHMSSVSADDAEKIREMFASSDGEPASSDDATSDSAGASPEEARTKDAKPRKRRGKRGGRRRRGRAGATPESLEAAEGAKPGVTSNGESDSAPPTASESKASAVEEAKAPTPDDAEGKPESDRTPAPKRRSSRKKKKKKAPSTSASTGEGQKEAKTGGRGRKRRKKLTPTSTKGADDVAAESVERDEAPPPSKTPESEGAPKSDEKAAAPTPKKRRVLYRSRKQVSPTAREAAAELTDA